MRRLFFLATALLLLSACSAKMPPTLLPTLSLQEQAALEATAIVEQAQATAMILQAREQATALLARNTQPASGTPAPLPSSTPSPAVREPVVAASATIGAAEQPAIESPTVDTNEDYKIELIDVTYGGDGGFVMVNFYATYKAASDLWQGSVSVTDEKTGTVYNEVATMPIIGPLIGRPKEWGQPGYVMLVNNLPGLPSNTLVTVVLGQLKQEHVPVRP